MNESCYCHCNPQKYGKRWLLTDFGFSTIVPSGKVGLSHGRRGTPGYLPPEFIPDHAIGNQNPAEYTTSADIWAMGCVIFELATAKRRRAFGYDNWYAVNFAKGLSPVPQLTNHDNPFLGTPIFSRATNTILPMLQQFNSILELCFAVDPKRRLNALELKARFDDMKIFLIEKGHYYKRSTTGRSWQHVKGGD